MKRSIIVVVIAILALAVLLFMVFGPSAEDRRVAGITNFEECVEAGFEVMESHPRQCRAGDKLFIESIDEENIDPVQIETSMIRVTAPRAGALVSSPLVVRGEARGGWYFEADFPVRLLDANGKEIAATPATAQGDWMTNNFVPFEATLTFTAPATATGTLVLERDNPSGLPEHAAEVRIPVRFTATTATERSVMLYYYDESRDMDASGNIMCSEQGLVSVNRSITSTNTPIQDTIRLLLRGELTTAERAQGITTEFPLQGVSLTGANLAGGTLTLEFNDPQNRTSGGACRVGILWMQIEKTAKQFDNVNTVRFLPEELFQP